MNNDNVESEWGNTIVGTPNYFHYVQNQTFMSVYIKDTFKGSLNPLGYLHKQLIPYVRIH